jgi:hypothetical protein
MMIFSVVRFEPVGDSLWKADTEEHRRISAAAKQNIWMEEGN